MSRSDSSDGGTGLADQLRQLAPGTTVFVLAEGLPTADVATVTLFSVTDDVLIASNQMAVGPVPAGRRFVFNLDEVTAVAT